MAFFKRAMGLDFVDTALHVATTFFVAYLASEVLAPGQAADGAALASVFGASTALLAWRRQRALRQRPPETTGEVAAFHVQELEARVAELEQEQLRVHELEERLDFAERMLAQQREVRQLTSREDP